MKKLTKEIIALMILLLLVGCATRYQPAKGNITGGYTDLKVGPNMFRISFEGNAYITNEKAYQFILYRSAEIAKQNNHNWFEIIDQKEDSRREYAGFLGYVEKPHCAIVIKLVDEGISKNAYSAEAILQSVQIQ